MKVPEEYAYRVNLTTYGSSETNRVLVRLVGNSATGVLSLEHTEVGSDDPKVEHLSSIVNPGALAQWCAAYLAAYHDIRGRR